MSKDNEQRGPNSDDFEGIPESNSSSAGKWIDAPREEPSNLGPTSKADSAGEGDRLEREIEGQRRPDSFDELVASPSREGSYEEVTEVRSESGLSGKARSRRSAKGPLLIAGAVILTLALGFFGLMAFDGFQEQRETERVQQQEQRQEREKADAIKEAVNPFAVLVGEIDPPSEDPLDVTANENQLNVGSSTLSIKDGTLTPTINSCSLVAVTDICLGARAKLGDGDFDVLVVKDVSRTRLIDNPVEFNEIETAGSTVAASLAIDMGSAEGPTRFGVLNANSPTGFVLIFPEGTTPERVEEVLKAATVI